MRYVVWHNENGARRWGHIIDENDDMIWTRKEEAIRRADVIATADTVRDLEAEVSVHAVTCERCRSASASLLTMMERTRELARTRPSLSVVTAVPPDGFQYPFKQGDTLLWLGEIPNMPGHCAVVTRAGKVLWGYHSENFREPTPEEL